MSETSTTNTSTKSTDKKADCCGGSHGHAKKHKPYGATARREIDATPADEANSNLSRKSGCCCKSKHG